MWNWLTGGRFGYIADYLLWSFVAATLPALTYAFFKLFPRTRHPRWGWALGNALMFATLLGGVFWIGETYCRFVRIGTDSFGVTLSARRWFERFVTLNAWGCRDREWLPRPPANVYRIAFVGDSFLYGWGVERVEDRLSERVVSALSKRQGRPVESINFAQPGWDTGDQLEPLSALLDGYRVDEVVLVHVPNDIERLLPARSDFDPKRPPRCRWFNTDSSALGEWMYYFLYLPRVPTVQGFHDWLADGYADAGVWERQQLRLTALADACRSHGVTFRVVLFPFLRTGGGRFNAEQIARQHVEWAASRNLGVLDLRSTLTGHTTTSLVVSSQDAHPNALAHQLAAEEILSAFYSEGAAPAGSGASRAGPAG